MNWQSYINSYAKEYKSYLHTHLIENEKIRNVVNAVFFPAAWSIEEWLRSVDVKSFHEKRFTGSNFSNLMCARDQIDQIPSWPGMGAAFDRYYLFKSMECRSYEEAVNKMPTYYHFICDDFFAKLDQIILTRLGFNAAVGLHRHSKKVSDKIEMVLDFTRENTNPKNIMDYVFPSLSLRLNDSEQFDFGRIDVRNFLLLREGSFLFFYFDCHSYTIDNHFYLSNVIRKHDEPVIFYFEDKNQFVISNRLDNIARYNKYIQIVLELSLHFFGEFEKWLTQLHVDR